MTDEVDVVVTDGFTGNVALKTLEGGLAVPGRRAVRGGSRPRRRRRRRPTCSLPALAPLYD